MLFCPVLYCVVRIDWCELVQENFKIGAKDQAFYSYHFSEMSIVQKYDMNKNRKK